MPNPRCELRVGAFSAPVTQAVAYRAELTSDVYASDERANQQMEHPTTYAFILSLFSDPLLLMYCHYVQLLLLLLLPPRLFRFWSHATHLLRCTDAT